MPRPLKQLGICAVITGHTPSDFNKNIRAALAQKPDALELRLDYLYQYLNDSLLADLMISCSKTPVIATLRNKKRGGISRLSDKEEIVWLQKAIDLGAAYVDIDVNMPRKYIRMLHKKSAHIILSHHDFKKTPPANKQVKIAKRMLIQGADVCKIATFARSPSGCIETIVFIKTLCEQKIPVIGIAMGKHGTITRMLALDLGCYLTYAAVVPYNPIAPGLPTIQWLRSVLKKDSNPSQSSKRLHPFH